MIRVLFKPNLPAAQEDYWFFREFNATGRKIKTFKKKIPRVLIVCRH